MRFDFEYSSTAPLSSKPALDELLFFNEHQHLVREGILRAVEHFGQPRVTETSQGLRVRVGEAETQSLFAFDPRQPTHDPVGAVTYVRTSRSTLTIMHIAVHPDYAFQGRRGGAGLAVKLVEKVKEIAKQVAGVNEIAFFYQRALILRINRSECIASSSGSTPQPCV